MKPTTHLIGLSALLAALGLLVSGSALAQKVYLNPSNQTANLVAGGGNEAEYALIDANKAEAILDAAGLNAKVDQDFYNSPYNANSWGADIFVSIHTNAGGGHGTETLYKSNGGKTLAGKVQNGLLSTLPYQDRGLKYRDDLHVLNATDMYACLTEAVFHDCSAQSGFKGHPPSESSFLKSTEGQDKIAAGIASGICSYYGKSCGGGEPPPPAKGLFKGVVYKNPNMEDRIPEAKVSLNTGESKVADGNGYWEFELVPGEYTATATKDGYLPNSSTRTVEAGKEIWGSIGLDPAPVEPDGDGDGIPDASDNCPGTQNPMQEDDDKDGIGNACEAPPPPDSDGDGIPDASDNCPGTQNPMQQDDDGDGLGNACDPPETPDVVSNPEPEPPGPEPEPQCPADCAPCEDSGKTYVKCPKCSCDCPEESGCSAARTRPGANPLPALALLFLLLLAARHRRATFSLPACCARTRGSTARRPCPGPGRQSP
jgi:hypothetical protein